jgi:hypothetical protein
LLRNDAQYLNYTALVKSYLAGEWLLVGLFEQLPAFTRLEIDERSSPQYLQTYFVFWEPE